MNDKKALKTNLIFAGVLLAAALALFAVLRLRPAGGMAVLLGATIAINTIALSYDNILTQALKAMPSSIVGETHGADVIIIGRGGGSVEDLWAFNDESLARAVASSAIPVVSAVGHETDFTICDLAADVRASTPSAAAELCFPDMEVFRAQLANVGRALERTVRADIEKKRERVKELSSRRAMTSPMTLLDDHRVRLMQLSDRTERAIMSRLQTERFSLSSASARLQLLDPLAPLARGYAMITKNGRPVVSAGAVEVGDRLAVKLGDGEISVTADEVTYGGK